MKFYTYMMRNHKGEDSPAGDLAADMYRDKEAFPRVSELKVTGGHYLVRNYLARNGACSDCIEAFEECWAEWLEAERRRTGRPIVDQYRDESGDDEEEYDDDDDEAYPA